MARTEGGGGAKAIARTGWLRAAVLGANDGILSTGGLVLGVAAAAAAPHMVLITGASGLVAGAMSMAAGEYVSVSSQLDAENAALSLERKELREDAEGERRELSEIYVERGVDPALAPRVAEQLMAKDALAAHARDELGLTNETTARPIQAAFASAASFSAGAAMPLVMVVLSPRGLLQPVVAVASVICLALLGAVGAAIGGAKIARATIRVTFWGAAAMAVTSGLGALFAKLGALPG
jgi:VIT1/CCC1 family predicted Fe2+/Mn2+ transporter